jgi:hypothetical protein
MDWHHTQLAFEAGETIDAVNSIEAFADREEPEVHCAKSAM